MLRGVIEINNLNGYSEMEIGKVPYSNGAVYANLCKLILVAAMNSRSHFYC